jgi:thiamine biosynthesis lipoprotein
MRIGFGAIGKGYAADRAKSLLIALGVSAGIINASGDMNTWGKQPDGTPWEVAITNPLHKSTSYGLLPISEGAVVTSGDYENLWSLMENDTAISSILARVCQPEEL